VKGPKGTLTLGLRDEISYTIDGGRPDHWSSRPTTPSGSRLLGHAAHAGLQPGDGRDRGLHQGARDHRCRLSCQLLRARTLKLQLGYSHDVDFAVPEGIEIKTPDNTTVEISGIDKQKVGQVAAEIRRWRKPEPYKGKGIKYRGEYIFRKEGKKK
jgi:large subunit ribosomal protein L6